MDLQLFANAVKAHLGLGKEVAWGTPVAASAYIPLINESWIAEPEQVKDEGLRGVTADGEQYLGVWRNGGGLTFDVRPTSIGHILRSVFGAPVSTGVAPNYTHTFTPVDTDFSADCPLPPYTLELFRGIGSNSQQCPGGQFNSLQLVFGASQKIFRAVANGFSKGKPTSIAKTTPTYESNNPFLWRQLSFKLGDSIATAAVIAYLEYFSVTITNNVEGVETSGGIATDSIGRVDRNGLRVVDVQATLAIPDLAEYTKFLDSTRRAIDLTFSVDANTSLQLLMPNVAYEAFPVQVGGPGRHSVQVTGKAKYSTSDTHDVKAVLKNQTVSY